MKSLKFPLIALLVAGLLTIAFIGCKKEMNSPSLTSDAKGGVPVIQYAVPTLECAGSTLTSIDLKVTAGSTGAPSGFSIQWMTKEQFVAGGSIWPVYTTTDENGDPIDANFCKASFSGNAFSSRYNLEANEPVTITIGAFLFDNGASTTCPGELTPCTEYVFRVFAHGDSKKNRSNFSSDNDGSLTCKTECPDPNTTCERHGPGWWKNNCDKIPSTGLELYGETYTKDEVCTILNTNPSVVCTGSGKNKVCKANDLIVVGHQIIAAVLNGDDISSVDGSPSLVGQNFLTGYQPAGTYAGLIGQLRKHNESCTQ
jgi:hypothetical protein